MKYKLFITLMLASVSSLAEPVCEKQTVLLEKILHELKQQNYTTCLTRCIQTFKPNTVEQTICFDHCNYEKEK